MTIFLQKGEKPSISMWKTHFFQDVKSYQNIQPRRAVCCRIKSWHLMVLLQLFPVPFLLEVPTLVCAWMPSSSAPSIQLCREFHNHGVTSLLWMEEAKILVAGTKRGGIYCRINHTTKIENDDSKECYTWVRIDKAHDKKEPFKFPVYSLASSPFSETIFCGGGDRYISVWEKTINSGTLDGCVNQYDYAQELGPHTGWVKDLLYDQRNALLHSIGCNCIETWDCSETPRQHKKKRSIENSPTIGTTLSSDLLCLCLVENQPAECDDNAGMQPVLVSGGVDGRIHAWTSNLDLSCKSGKPLCSILAHDGRVNAAVYSLSLSVVFTIGHDGVLSAHRITQQDISVTNFPNEIKVSLETLASVQISEKMDNLRLTSIVILQDDTEKKGCRIAIGSSEGKIRFGNVSLPTEEDITLSMDPMIFALDGSPLVYNLACETATGTAKVASKLWIAHATGLAFIDLT
jgi:WD40 repeat protein